MVEGLLVPIKKENHKLALDGKSDNAASSIKKAPVSGGCRVEGYLRAKKVTKMSRTSKFCEFFFVFFSFLMVVPFFVFCFQVPGEVVISAHSHAHSFDASKMNMSHFVTHLSFGNYISERLLTDMKRLLPYFGRNHDKLNGKWFVNQGHFAANVTVSPTDFHV